MDFTYVKNCPLAAPGLAIHGAASLLPKVSNTVLTKIDGNIYPAVTAADLPAMTGINVPLVSTLPIAVVLSKAGVYTYVQGNAVLNANLNDNPISLTGNAVVSFGNMLPQIQGGFAIIGWIMIKTTSTAVFTGGTTALDAANVTVTYIDNFGFSGR